MERRSSQKHLPHFTFVDLFAGIGGMRLAFESIGGECLLTSEIDSNALLTYKLNFKDGPKHKYVPDVNKINPQEIKSITNKIDVLVAGFPCQPYSIAGLRKGLKDDRGGRIFKSLLNILENLKPRSFMLENVKGIVNHDDGKTFKYMIEELSNTGYVLKFQNLNSATHSNIPQNRERIFIVGFKSKENAKNFNFPSELKLVRQIENCLISEKADQKYYYDDRYAATKIINKHVKELNTIYQWRRHYVRQNKSQLCPTLTANMGSGGHNVPLIFDGFGVRKLTPRECANFQGFPKSFQLPNISDSKLYHQFGNSVTVPLIKRIAQEIVKVLD